MNTSNGLPRPLRTVIRRIAVASAAAGAVGAGAAGIPHLVQSAPATSGVRPAVVAPARPPQRFPGFSVMPDGRGYRMVQSTGRVRDFGDAHPEKATRGPRLTDAAAMATTRSGRGYWVVSPSGQVEAFGDAHLYGSMPRGTRGVVAIAPTPDSKGYWIATRSGHVSAFGDARPLGSIAKPGPHPVVGMATLPDGRGYWLVRSDGAVFSFGDARYHGAPRPGSTTSVVGIAASRAGAGYWIATAQGGVMNFGKAAGLGSAAGHRLTSPISGIAARPGGGGYWLTARDGGVAAFGDAISHGGAAPDPVVPLPKPAPTGVGVYGFFPSEPMAVTGIRDGWPIIGDAGALGIPQPPYVAETSDHPDLNVVRAIAAEHKRVTWLSFWTVSWPEKGDTYEHAGYVAGRVAARTLDGYSATIRPDFVVLDPEGFNQANAAQNYQQWAEFLGGWAKGLHSINPSLKAGFYANQSQFLGDGLNRIPMDGFVAISPIIGNTPEVRGGDIHAYTAYVANCPAGPDVRTMKAWAPKAYSTLQFNDNGVDCAP